MANEEMIQKHIDNFLAKIAGETPVDDTIQNSTEFWINKIAEHGGGMANEEMIQKHLDNFLAKIAGETPVDDAIQNSTEFWLNQIAERGSGGLKGGYLVRFIVNGEPYCNISVLAGDAVQEPSEPVVEGFAFEGWYTSGGHEVAFPFTPAGNVTIYAHVVEKHIVGIQGFGTSDPSVTMFGDIADVPMWTTETDGDYVSVKNPLDDYWPFNKIEEFTDSNGNVFVKFPKMWMRWLEGSTTEHWIEGVRFASYKVDDNYFISDAFLDPKDTTGKTHLEYFALGKYEGSGSSSKVYSKSGQVCLTSITRGNFQTGCRAYGTGSNYYNGYQGMDIQQRTIYNLLCMMYYRTKNIKTVFSGRTGASSHSWTTASNTGTTDGVAGMNGWNTETDCVKMLGVENPYGNIAKNLYGMLMNEHYPYIERFPQNYSDVVSGVSIGFYIPYDVGSTTKRLRAGTSEQTRSVLLTSATIDTLPDNSQYYGDYYNVNTGKNVATVGGTMSNKWSGIWAMSVDGDYTTAMFKLGGRLAYRPVNE